MPGGSVFLDDPFRNVAERTAARWRSESIGQHAVWVDEEHGPTKCWADTALEGQCAIFTEHELGLCPHHYTDITGREMT